MLSTLSSFFFLVRAALALGLAAAGHEFFLSSSVCGAGQPPLELGSRWEVFVDNLLIHSLEKTRLKLHEPKPAGTVLQFDQPWEGAFCGYVTVLLDNGIYRMFYRGLPKSGRDGSSDEVTCYAESRDGIVWVKPSLGLYEREGSRSNNIVLAGQAPFSHNFAPFLDARPGVPASEKWKALAGTAETCLFGFISGDGQHWQKLREKPLLRQGAFDSQNVGFWSEAEGCYVAYFRTWSSGEFKGYRTISRSTSTNFTDWSAPMEMGFGDTPREHLYTSQTHPYFRAPQLYIATPMRFMPGRQVLTDEQAQQLGVGAGYAGDCADTVLMASRGGTQYTRLFMESFIRPGPDLGNWASRAGLAALGVVPTGDTEMSLYKQAHYAQPSHHLVRHVLRTDGFVSINAPYAGGEALTKTFTFSGRELLLNFATGAAGSVRVELQDLMGHAYPGFGLAEAVELVGDQIERVVRWKKGRDVSGLAGKPVRMRLVMRDADVWAFRFR